MTPDSDLRDLRRRVAVLEAEIARQRDGRRHRSRLLSSAGKLCPVVAVLALAGWAVGQGVEIKTSDGAADQTRFKVESGLATVSAYFLNTKVGVGTNSPVYPFHLQVDDGLTAGEHVLGVFRRTSAGGGAVFAYQANGAAVTASRVRSSQATDLRLGTGGNGDIMTLLESNGNVGIGTTTPENRLHVEDLVSTHIALQLENADGAAGIELENQGSTASGEAILNLGVNTNRGLLDKGTNPLGLWFRLDTRAAQRRFAWFSELDGSDTETQIMTLSDTGNLGVGMTAPDVRLYLGNASSTANETLKIASQEDAAIHLLSDTDNDNANGEDDNTYILFAQDAGVTQAVIGHTGTTNEDPLGNAYTGTTNNNLLIGTIGSNPVKVGTNGAVRMTIANDGGVGIGDTAPGTYRLVVKELASASDNGIRIINLAGDKTAQFWVGTGGAVFDAEGTTNLHLRTAGADRLFIQNATGEVGIGTTAPDRRLHVKDSRGGAAGTNCIAHIENTAGSYADCLWLDQTGENGGTGSDFIEFHTNAGKIGDIDSDGGSVVNYNAFQGTHPSQTRQDLSRWRKGMIVRATGELMKNSDSQPMTELADRDDDPGVYGVFWDMDPDQNWVFGDDVLPMFKLLGLGHGQVLVTDAGGDLRVGDYVTTTSLHPGYGRRQTDRVLQSHTVGKALEAVDWDDVPVDPKLGFKWKMIAIVLVCG